MSPDEWLACDSPQRMLAWLTGYVGITGGQAVAANYPCPVTPSARKLRLLAVAVARHGGCGSWARVGHLVAAAEAMADGLPHGLSEQEVWDAQPYAASWLVEGDAKAVALHVLGHYEPDPEDREAGPEQAAILRDLIDPFGRVVVLPRDLDKVLGRGAGSYRQQDVVLADWLTPQVEALAHAAYDLRLPGGQLDPVTLLALADALEEGGCPDGALLRHLRGMEWCIDETHRLGGGVYWCPRCGGSEEGSEGWMDLRGPHWRGCWAVDLLLGRC